ncbi:hypothetical protein PQX77_007352, partial [Marasmius sp. AFHP31]
SPPPTHTSRRLSPSGTSTCSVQLPQRPSPPMLKLATTPRLTSYSRLSARWAPTTTTTTTISPPPLLLHQHPVNLPPLLVHRHQPLTQSLSRHLLKLPQHNRKTLQSWSWSKTLKLKKPRTKRLQTKRLVLRSIQHLRLQPRQYALEHV